MTKNICSIGLTGNNATPSGLNGHDISPFYNNSIPSGLNDRGIKRFYKNDIPSGLI